MKNAEPHEHERELSELCESSREILRGHLAAVENHLNIGIIPFWFARALDKQYGGFMTNFGEQGEALPMPEKYLKGQRQGIWPAKAWIS